MNKINNHQCCLAFAIHWTMLSIRLIRLIPPCPLAPYLVFRALRNPPYLSVRVRASLASGLSPFPFQIPRIGTRISGL